MYRNENYINFARFLRYIPTAAAVVQGGELYPDVNGTVRFYDTAYGAVVFTEIVGLPQKNKMGDSPIFSFGIRSLPPKMTELELPPLKSVGGIAFSAFLCDLFTAQEIIGMTAVIRDESEKMRIACGEISGVRR